MVDKFIRLDLSFVCVFFFFSLFVFTLTRISAIWTKWKVRSSFWMKNAILRILKCRLCYFTVIKLENTQCKRHEAWSLICVHPLDVRCVDVDRISFIPAPRLDPMSFLHATVLKEAVVWQVFAFVLENQWKKFVYCTITR